MTQEGQESDGQALPAIGGERVGVQGRSKAIHGVQKETDPWTRRPYQVILHGICHLRALSGWLLLSNARP